MRRKILFVLIILFVLQCFSASVSGFVSNAKNGERLPYITVLINGTELGSYTNKEGYFVINDVPIGEIEVVFSNLSYKQKRIKKNIKDELDDLFLRVELEKEAILLDEITVTESRLEKEVNSREVVVSNIIQTTDDLLDIPQIADADVFRAIQVLPGVTSISDFSSGLYVRGGSPDQNLILLDETDVYNPSHFGGIFSTFNTDAIETVDLSKGGFPAKYGGRLSSVMNVTNLDGNRKHHQGVARTSLISSSATVQGPWQMGKQKGSYMGSFRRTYLELFQQLIDGIPDYYFYDGHAKLNWDITEKDKFTTSFYFGKDQLSFDFGSELILDWGNETFTNQWVHVFNAQLFSHFIVSGSHFGLNFNVESDADEKWIRENDIHDFTIKGILNYIPNDRHMIDFGWESKLMNVGFEMKAINTNVDQSTFPNVQVDSGIHAAFVQDSWQLSDRWTVQPGIRLTFSHAESSTLDESPKGEYFRLSPRISLRYKLDDTSNTFFNYGRYHQYLTSLNMGTSTPFDLWFPLDGSVEPGQSDHYIWGIKKQFSNTWALDFELYYKDYKNLVEYKTETDYEWNNETGKLSDVFNIGNGFSYGADVLLRTDLIGLEGFIGYGFGLTKRHIHNVNVNPETLEETWFYPRYDRTHQINIVETLNVTEKTGREIWGAEFRIGTTYSFATGQPYWKPEQVYYDQESLQILYSYSDHIRLPNYSRFDLSMKLKWYFKKWTFEPYLQVINLFNHKNVWSVDYTYEFEEDGTVHINEHQTNMFPMIPFIGFNIEW